LDRVIIIRLVDANSRLLALQSGDIDIAVDIAPESVVTVENEPELLVRLVPITTLIFMFLNHQREAVQDPLLRQAIASAIDRDALVRAVMQDQASVSPGLLPPTVIECPKLQSQGFDPAKAKQLLTQIGLRDQDGDGYVEKDGQMVIFTLLTYKQRPALPPMAEAIQSMLKAIGIKVVIRVVESPTTAVQQQSDWDGALWFGATSYIGEPSPFLAQWLVTSGAANYGHFSSPQFDQQVARMGQTSDRQKREKLACAAFQEVVDEVAVVPLLFPHFNVGVSRKVTGFEPYNNRYLLDSKIGKE
jgi:peptide/nickel transport system substrate-binding protein